jgi:hypothetical protein
MSPDFLEESEYDEREHEREREHLQKHLSFNVHLLFSFEGFDCFRCEGVYQDVAA